MGTFSYTSGTPANLTGGAAANMADISGPFTDLRTFVNGSIDATNMTAAEAARIGLSQTGSVRRGSSIIATEESRTNTAYGTLTTPDRVSSVVVPTDGLLFVAYRALVKQSVANTAQVAIFLGATQLAIPSGTGAPTVTESQTFSPQINDYNWIRTALDTTTGWAQQSGVADSTSVTTGLFAAQPLQIELAAGTYDVSVQFKASSGSVTAKDRKLWVWTKGF